MPYNGGLVAWVTEALGPQVGAHCAYWMWASDVIDSAVYPCLAATYLSDAVPVDNFPAGRRVAENLIAMLIIILVTCIKLAGSNVLVAFSTLLMVLSLIPCALYICWGFTVQMPSRWTSTTFFNADAEVDFSLLISWLLWLYSGFVSVGTVAGEVQRPTRTFPIVMGLLIPTVILINAMPLTVAISQDPNSLNFASGYFAPLAEELAGLWLGVSFIVAAQLCLIGSYNSGMIASERELLFYLEENHPGILTSWRNSGNKVVRWLCLDNNTGVSTPLSLHPAI